MKSYNPRSLDEFITLQASLPAQTQILSGGTDWIIAHRRKAEDLPALLWIGGIPDLKRIAIDDQGQLHIGACCTMAALEQSDLLRGAFRVIAEAAASVGSTQIRNRATIGGNIANASPAADLAAPLIALNASAHILREGAVFDLPVSELITGAEKAVLRPLDILALRSPPFPKRRKATITSWDRASSCRSPALASQWSYGAHRALWSRPTSLSVRLVPKPSAYRSWSAHSLAAVLTHPLPMRSAIFLPTISAIPAAVSTRRGHRAA